MHPRQPPANKDKPNLIDGRLERTGVAERIRTPDDRSAAAYRVEQDGPGRNPRF